jgi:hypothetical protein
MLFVGLRTAGRDAIDLTSSFVGDYARGYATIETVFPGISELSSTGKFNKYNGRIDLFASRVKSENGGSIDYLVPGGGLTVGLSNTPESLVGKAAVKNSVLGIVAVGGGSIKGVTRDDLLVNQSRVLSVGGGDVLLWSSEGDIDAGKGKKTATSVPPPIVTVDDKGNVTQVLQGAVSGSGIGALKSGPGKAGDVDLYAPKGTINAGDAGIRAANFFGGAQFVIGAENISVSGRSVGTPIADTSAVTAAASGATSSGNDVSKTSAAVSQTAAAAAANSQAQANAFKSPAIVNVEVLGFGQ